MAKAELAHRIQASIDSLVTVIGRYHSEKGYLRKYTSATKVVIHYRPNKAIGHFQDPLGNLVERKTSSSGAQLAREWDLIMPDSKALT